MPSASSLAKLEAFNAKTPPANSSLSSLSAGPPGADAGGAADAQTRAQEADEALARAMARQQQEEEDERLAKSLQAQNL